MMIKKRIQFTISIDDIIHTAHTCKIGFVTHMQLTNELIVPFHFPQITLYQALRKIILSEYDEYSL